MIKVSSLITVFYRGKDEKIVIYMFVYFENYDPKSSKCLYSFKQRSKKYFHVKKY